VTLGKEEGDDCSVGFGGDSGEGKGAHGVT